MHNWQQLTDFISDKQRLMITTHLHPDGDAVGSQTAMAHFLRQQNKQVFLFNVDPTPHYFSFMDAQQEIMIFSGSRDHLQLIRRLDGVIVVDASDWNRLGRLGPVIKEYNLPLACIDHHIQTEAMGQIQIIDQTVSSTGELVYDFLSAGGCIWTQEIIDALYTSIMTDTGSFRYSNTTARAHQIAADMLDKGAQFHTIFDKIYQNYSKERMVLMGRLLADMRFLCRNRLVYFVLTQALLQETGVELWETEGFSEIPRSIAGVQVSILFTEMNDGTTKASFRSKGRIPINDLAAKLGGGGHPFASGATMPMDLQTTITTVLQQAAKLFT